MELNDQIQTLQLRKKVFARFGVQILPKWHQTSSEPNLNLGDVLPIGWGWLEVESVYFDMEGHLKCTKSNHQNHFPFASFQHFIEANKATHLIITV